ncbi:ribonuclease [Sphingomonas crusticola]|uniref:ribonuclease n=1 Tax=Sphingomonas crusticola TaxID=1697973 RepID=UPI000E27C11D|nr:ribonuclease [Sphingomonas crusticola]
MAEWLYEAGIGENRAALIDGGRIVEMALERDDDPGPRLGAVLPGRLTRKADASGRGLVTLAGGAAVQLTPVPAWLTEGSAVTVEITREPIPEGAELKPARAKIAAADAMLGPGPDLLTRIGCSGVPVRQLGRSDSLDAYGWSDAVEEAASGLVATSDLLLRISPTPAMTLIDVDGAGSAVELGVAGARAAGQAIRRFGIAGSIGIDLPTMTAKADRQAAAAALDAVLPQPFERTAVNGFGFLQIVRRRERPSVIDRIAADPIGAAALELIRRATRASGHGVLTLHAHPRVIAPIAARVDWLDALARRAGASVALREESTLAISAGHASRATP